MNVPNCRLPNAFDVCSIFLKFWGNTLHSEFFLLWVGEKLHFSRLARFFSNHRLYNAFGVWGIFPTLAACAMRGQVSASWVIRKVDFFKVARVSSSYYFYNALFVRSIFCKFQVCTDRCDSFRCVRTLLFVADWKSRFFKSYSRKLKP